MLNSRENEIQEDKIIANSNIALDNFIKSLKYTGLQQIKVVARAIASHKADAPYLRSPQICRAHQAGEAVVEAAVALVDNEDKLIPILEAYKEKYPNAIQQLCCSELNQSSNVSDNFSPQGKIIELGNYNNKNTDKLIN